MTYWARECEVPRILTTCRIRRISPCREAFPNRMIPSTTASSTPRVEYRPSSGAISETRRPVQPARFRPCPRFSMKSRIRSSRRMRYPTDVRESRTMRSALRSATRSRMARVRRSTSSIVSSSWSRPRRSYISGRSTKTRWPLSTRPLRKKSNDDRLSMSFWEDSVTEMKRQCSPRSAPRTRYSRLSVVFPVPTEPASSTMFPLGIPPPRMWSRPSIPVTHRSRGASGGFSSSLGTLSIRY